MLSTGIRATAQESTPPATAAERESLYNDVLARRVDNIMQKLALTDTNKADRVRSALLIQYRTLRLRDEFIDARLSSQGVDPSDLKARAGLREELSTPLRKWFVTLLAVDLTPDQVDVVKDQMTYGKLKVTYDAYCAIIPDLSDKDKAKVMELLTAARDEAIDGGSAPEKSAIFQVYKDQINAYLNASGHDVDKAFKDWEAKQAAQSQMAAGK